MNNREIIDQYCKDVLSGKIVSCQHVINAVKRYKRDLKNKEFYFDEKAANIFISFIEMLPHVKGQPANEKRLLKLEPVQKFIIWNLFGFKRKESGKRRFRHAYIEMAKKNAKSTLAAAIALAMFMLDGEQGAEIYSAATTSEQAGEVFAKTAVKMWQKCDWMQKDSNGNTRISKSQYQLTYDKYGSFFKALPGDADTAEGKNAHCAIIDEYHVHKTNDLVDNISTGSITRAQPMIIRITTAGKSRKVPCYSYRSDCINVLNQVTNDESLFIMIFGLDDGDDWHNQKLWPKAHPLWYSNPELRAGVLSEYNAAQRSSTKAIDFQTKMLSVWTDSAKNWITDKKYMASAGEMSFNELLDHLKGRECYGGLDLSKSQDMSAFTLVFPNDDGSFYSLSWAWLPEERAMNRKSHHYHNFLKWRNEGYLQLTDGDVIDHEFIRAFINDLAADYVINSIAYDRAFAVTLVTELTADGLTLNPFGQGYVSMGAPTSELESLILSGKFMHGGHPVARWSMSNVAITNDAAGNMKIDKSKSHESVDITVSQVMALGQYMLINSEQEQYWIA